MDEIRRAARFYLKNPFELIADAMCVAALAVLAIGLFVVAPCA